MSNFEPTLDEKFDLSASLSARSPELLELDERIDTLEDTTDRLACEQRYVVQSSKMTIVDRIKAYHRDLKIKKLKFKLHKLHEKRDDKEASFSHIQDESNPIANTTPVSATPSPVSCVTPTNIEPNPETRLAEAMNRLGELHEKRRKARSLWASAEEKNNIYKINAQYAFVQSDIVKIRKEINGALCSS